MGISSDGILVFGVDFGDRDTIDEVLPAVVAGAVRSSGGLDGLIAREAGVPERREDETKEEREARWDREREAVALSPVEEQLHCAYDYGMTILAVRSYVYRASRGCPEEITENMLHVPAEKIAAFKQWLVDHGIKPEEPRWILTSLYG